MNKIIYIILATILMTFSGCNMEHVNPDKVSKEHMKQVLDYLSNDDTEGLKDMFCEEIKSSDKIDLDEQLDEAMKFFDGKVESYDDFTRPNIEKVEGGGQKEVSIMPSATVKTDTGKSYKVRFNAYIVYKEDKEKVGISDIHITTSDEKGLTVGDYDIVNPETIE